MDSVERKFRFLTHLFVQGNSIYTEYDMKFIKEMEDLIEVNFLENPFHNEE